MYVFKITNERTNGRLFCVCVCVWVVVGTVSRKVTPGPIGK